MITDCYSTATVTGWDGTGGLVGRNSGAVSSCHATGDVTGNNETGGLAGENTGEITASYAAATVWGGLKRVGGLVGYNLGRISSSYASATVVGEVDRVGGLVGDNEGAVFSCYSTGKVTGEDQVGGLVGLNDGLLETSYSATMVDCYGWYAGGLAGRLSLVKEGKIKDCYLLAPPGATIALVASSGGAYDWTRNPGAGTADHPYEVQTAGQLESLIDHPELWDRHFVLSADLDMTGRQYEVAPIAPDVNDFVTDVNDFVRDEYGRLKNVNDLVPDVNNPAADFQGTPFRGVFHGQGHTIRNLTIVGGSGTPHEYVGLFGMVTPEGRVEDLHLRDARIRGGRGTRSFVGALAGYNAGTIVDCSATGVIDGGKGDGLVGFNTGTLSNSQARMARVPIGIWQ
jgi:hypothetical protein